MGYPQIIHLNRIVHYRPSSLGYPHLWNPRFATSLRANENLLKNAGEPSKQRPWGSLRDKHQVVLWCSKRPSSFHNLGVNAWTSPTFNTSYFSDARMNRSTTFFHTKPGSLGGYKTRIILGGRCGQPDELLEKFPMNLQDKSPLRWPGTSKFTKKWCQCQKSAGNFHSCEIHMLFLGFSPNLSSHQDPRALRSLSSISRHRAVPHRCFDTAASSRKPAHGDRNGNSPQGCWITPSRSRQSQRKRAMSATKPRRAHTLRPFCCHFWWKVSWECLSLWVQSNKMQLCYSKTRVNHPKIYHKWMV